MDNIAQNPYRVLGVFVNDPLRVRIANTARIRAFNKVGKSCSFDSDFEELFGKIDRSEESILRAERQLSSLEEAEFYGLLWLHRSSHLPSSPSAIADIVSASINHDSFDDLVNTIIGVLYVGNYNKAAELILELFHCQDNIVENNKRRFLRYIIDTFDECSLTNWWYTFKDICLKDKQHSSILIFLCDFFNAVSLSKLRLITEFGSLNRDTIEWKNLATARIWANSIIDVVKDSSNIESQEPNAESQIVLSEYAQTMLRACDKYYKSTRFWDAKPVMDILIILREVYKISYSSKIKDECTELGIKLKNESKYLAPATVRKFAIEIRKHIEAFCQKPNETQWSLELLSSCVSPLKEIRNELGNTNLYYKRISSQIANNALYACEEEIDRIENIYEESFKIIEKKKGIISSAVQLCADIKALELDDTFNVSKFEKLIGTLNLLCEKYNETTIQNIKSTIVFNSGSEILRQDYKTLVEYMKNTPNGVDSALVLKRISEIEDKEYPINETVESLLAYKKKFQNSHNDVKVLQALNRLLLGMSIGSITEYQTFLCLYPNHEKKNVILGRIDLLTYKACKSITDFEKYLKDFPHGQHCEEAKQKILQIKQSDVAFIFQQCKTIIDYNRFILKYPSSTLYEKAYNKIEDLIYQDVLSTGNLSEYYKRYPYGRYIPNLKGIEDDNKFKECKTIDDFIEYKRLYPNGKNIVKANLVIEQAKDRKRNRFLLFAFVIAIVATVIYFSNNNNNEPDIQSRNNISQQIKSYSNNQPETNYKNNSLETGAKPYASQFETPISGDNHFEFKTSSGHDYVVIIKRHYDNRYINHIYIKGGETARLYVPDGDFDVYFYSGKGWNPNKKVSLFTGGFTTGGNMQKDGPVELYSAYMEYTLYPVTNGNLRLKGADINDVFN